MNRSMHEPTDSAEYSHPLPEMSDLLAMAREILAASEEQEWQHVSGLVSDWRGALDRFFENDAITANATLELDEVCRLKEINSRVIALAEQYKVSLTTQLKALKRGRKAVSAYSANHAK